MESPIFREWVREERAEAEAKGEARGKAEMAQEATGKEVLLNYCKKQSAGRVKPGEARQILERLPFSLSERVRTEREEK